MGPGSRVRAESIAMRNALSVNGRSRLESSRKFPRAINASTYVYAMSSSGTYADACDLRTVGIQNEAATRAVIRYPVPGTRYPVPDDWDLLLFALVLFTYTTVTHGVLA